MKCRWRDSVVHTLIKHSEYTKQAMVISHLLRIAKELNLKPSQIRKWKSEDKWDELFN